MFPARSIGLVFGHYPLKWSSPPRPGCTGLTHCISIFPVLVAVFLRLRGPQSQHLLSPFPGLAPGPLRPLQGLCLRLPAAVAAPAPPARRALFRRGRPAGELPNESAGLESDSSGNGQSSRAREGGRRAGAEVGLNGGRGKKGQYKRGELGPGAQERKPGRGDRPPARPGEGTAGWTRLLGGRGASDAVRRAF